MNQLARKRKPSSACALSCSAEEKVYFCGLLFLALLNVFRAA